MGDGSYHNIGIMIILPMLLVGMILINIQLLEHELVVPMDMTNLLIAVALLIEVLDTISMVLSSSNLQGHIIRDSLKPGGLFFFF